MVTPADIKFIGGKQQQYTAKALDQNGQVMAITPVWSITGNGNSITTGGLATLDTSGVITATATVNGVTKSATTYANLRAANYKPIPAKIQAEQFDNSNSCCTEPTSDTGGGANVSYIGIGTWFEYDIAVPPGNTDYRIQFRVAVSTASSLKIQLDSNTLQTVNLPVSGGWQNWATVSSAPITLSPGNQTIRIYSNKDGWNFNWLSFVQDSSAARVAYVAPVIAREERLLIYPNPTPGQVTINLQGKKYKIITLLDIQGNVIRQWGVRAGEKQISKDLGFLPAGTYLLRFDRQQTYKFMKL
jgi:hypothetical protein